MAIKDEHLREETVYELKLPENLDALKEYFRLLGNGMIVAYHLPAAGHPYL